jgi:hypothetical protein
MNEQTPPGQAQRLASVNLTGLPNGFTNEAGIR